MSGEGIDVFVPAVALQAAPAGFVVHELRFVLEEHRTRVFAWLRAVGDVPPTVQGWHGVDFPPTMSVAEIIVRHMGEVAAWPNAAPPATGLR